MKAENFRYYRGSRDSRETIEIDLTKAGTYITTCVVNADLLICGIYSHPCGNGDDYKLEPETRLEVLEYLKAERKKLTEGVEVKGLQDWHESGLPSFEDYVKPGDKVSEELVDDLVNSVPPVMLRSDCTQIGEAYSIEADDYGRGRNTYATFHRTGENLWIFDGYCFKNENINRDCSIPRLDREISELKHKLGRR